MALSLGKKLQTQADWAIFMHGLVDNLRRSHEDGLSLLLFFTAMLLLIFKLFKKTRQGNAESQYTLSTMHEIGEGVAEDD